MQERIQLKQEEIVGDQTVLNDIYPKTNTNSIDDTNSGVPLNTTIDRMWNSINNKLSRIVNSVNGRTGVVVLNSEDVGLGNVDNVSLADIKNWVINRMQEEFNVKRIELFDYLDDVDNQLVEWNDDKLYADIPFYSHHGHKSKNENGLSDDRGYIGYIYWNDTTEKLDYTCMVIDTIGSSDSSIIYNEKVADIDYENSGRIGVNIWQYEDALEVYNRDDSNKANGGLRINRDNINQKIYFFEGVYGNGDPNDDEALLYIGNPPSDVDPVRVDIYIDNVLTEYSDDNRTFGQFNFNGNNYIKQKFKKNDIIICQFSDKNYTDTSYHVSMFKTKMNPQLLLNTTCIGQVTDVPNTETYGGRYVIKFYSIKQNLYSGLKEYSLKNYSLNSGIYRNALGLAMLSIKSDITHTTGSDSIVENVPHNESVESFNFSGMNTLYPYLLDYPKTRDVSESAEYNKKHVQLITPMGSTNNFMESLSGEDASADTSAFISTNFSLCTIPGYYGTPNSSDESANYGNIKNWPASILKHEDDVYDNSNNRHNKTSHIGINLEKMIIGNETDNSSYAINVSGLKVLRSDTKLDTDWFNGGFDSSLKDLNKFHSGGLSVNVGNFLEIGTPSLEEIDYYNSQYYNATTASESKYYQDGKVNVRINTDMGLFGDGQNRIAVKLSKIADWSYNNKAYDQDLIGGGLTFVDTLENEPGANVEWGILFETIAILTSSGDSSYYDRLISLFDQRNSGYVNLNEIPSIYAYKDTLDSTRRDSDNPHSMYYLIEFARQRKNDKIPTPESMGFDDVSFKFCQSVACEMYSFLKDNIDKVHKMMVEYNADDTHTTKIKESIVQQFEISDNTSSDASSILKILKIYLCDYNPERGTKPRITKGISVNRGIGLKMSHYKTPNVWTALTEPEMIGISIFDSKYSTSEPVKPTTDEYVHIGGEAAPTFETDKYYYIKSLFSVLAEKPHYWNSDYYKYYTKRVTESAFVNVQSAIFPIWIPNKYYTKQGNSYSPIVEQQPPDWETSSYKYYERNFTQIIDAPDWENDKYYAYNSDTNTFVPVSIQPQEWYAKYMYLFYKNENDEYVNVQSKTVPEFPTSGNTIYYKKVQSTSSETEQYVLLESKPSNWDTNSYEYYVLEYVPILNPPQYVANKYYSAPNDSSKMSDTNPPPDWRTKYFNYYVKEDLIEYISVPEKIAPVFESGKYYKMEDGHPVSINTEPDDWSTEYDKKYYISQEINQRYPEVMDVYRPVEENHGQAPEWCEHTYYSRNSSGAYIETTEEPANWSKNYTQYYRRYREPVETDHIGIVYVNVPGVVYIPQWYTNTYYSKTTYYETLTEAPSDWSTNWMDYYIKQAGVIKLDAKYDLYYDMKNISEYNIHNMYGGLRHLISDDNELSAIGIRISKTDALNGLATHVGSEALKITDDNVLGVQLYTKGDNSNPLDIVSAREYVEKVYGDHIYLPATTKIYPLKTAFPTIGEVDRVYVDTRNGTDYIRYIWNPKSGEYEEMLEFYESFSMLPERGDLNKLYVVGVSGELNIYSWGHLNKVLYPDVTGSDTVTWIDAQETMNCYADLSTSTKTKYTYEQQKRMCTRLAEKPSAADSSTILDYWANTYKGDYTNDLDGWRKYMSERNVKDDPREDVSYFLVTKLFGFTPGLDSRYDECSGITIRPAMGRYNYDTGEAHPVRYFYKTSIAVNIKDFTARNVDPSKIDKVERSGLRFNTGGALGIRINNNSKYDAATGLGEDDPSDGTRGLMINEKNVLGIKVKESRKDLTFDNAGNLIISDEYRPTYELSLNPLIITDSNQKSIAYNGSQSVEITLGPGLYISYGDEETGEMSEDEQIIRDYSTILGMFQTLGIMKSVHVIRELIMNSSVFDNSTNIDTVYFPDFDEDGRLTDVDAKEILAIYADIVTGGNTYTDEEKLMADVNHDGLVNSADVSCVEEFIANPDYKNNAEGWKAYSGYELGIWDSSDYYPDNLNQLETMMSTVLEFIRDKLKDEDILKYVNDGMNYDDSGDSIGWRTSSSDLLTGIGKVIGGMSVTDRGSFCRNHNIPYSAISDYNEIENIIFYIKNNKTIAEAVAIYEEVYDQIPDSSAINKYTLLQQRIWTYLTMHQAIEFAKQGAIAGYVKGVTILEDGVKIPFPNVADSSREELTYSDIEMINNSEIPLPDLIKEKCNIDHDDNVWPMIDIMMIQEFIIQCSNGTYDNNVTGWHNFLHDKYYLYELTEIDEYFPYSMFLLKSMVRSTVFAIRTKSSYNKIQEIYNKVVADGDVEPSGSGYNLTISKFDEGLRNKINNMDNDTFNAMMEKYEFDKQPSKPDTEDVPTLKSWLIHLMLENVKVIPIATLVDIYDTH